MSDQRTSTGTSSDRQVAVRGIVTASTWDVAGNPTGVVVLTRFEDEVPVECHGAGAGLLEQLTREVVVCGHMVPGPMDGRILRPRSFAVIKSLAADVLPPAECRQLR